MGKIIIYQIFTRLFGNRNHSRIENGSVAENGCGKMNFFDDKCLKSFKERGITHVWYTGIIRHATQTDYSAFGIPKNHSAVVKGKAGSPYAITDYYDVDPDIAVDVDNRMVEFEQLIKRTHDVGLKAVIDFVPNHVARQYHSIAKPKGVVDLGEDDDKSMGFSPQNNFYYCPGCQLEPTFDLKGNESESTPYVEEPAKATGNDHFDNRPDCNDWYETIKLNYGVDYYAGHVNHFNPVPNTWYKMLEILLFWASKGIDAFRCDMAEMVPAEFWGWATSRVKEKYPSILFIGEVYNPNEYRNYIYNGFDYLYDKVGMYDCLRAVVCKQCSASDITRAWQQVDDINDNMLFFLENHDEQRIASDFFAGNATKAVPAMITSVTMRNNPFMLYAGQEYGEKGMDKEGFSGVDGRTTIFDYWCVDTLYRADKKKLTADEKHLADIYKRVLLMANKEKCFYDGLFYDLMYANNHSENFNSERAFVFIRKKDDEMILVAVNFDETSANMAINIPDEAYDYLNIPEGNYTATELLSGNKQDISLKKQNLLMVNVDGYSASVIKFAFN